MKSLPWQIACITTLTILAFWFRFADLGRVNLYNDEYYQFETAVGFLKTGQFARYDFYTNELGKPYTRALPFILQIIGSMKLFGVSEMAARLPAVLWGTLLIPFVIITVRWLTQQPLLAYATGMILTFDDFMIGLSRYVRMYTMLIFLSVVIVVAVFAFAEAHTKKRWWWLLAALIATIVSVNIFKELSLALAGAIGFYLFLRSLVFFWQRRHTDKWWAILALVGLVCTLGAVVFQSRGYNVFPTDAIILREQPHWSYLHDLYLNWRVPIAAYIFFVIGIASQWRQRRSFILYCGLISVVVVLYFVFFSHRWDAQRYISFVLPMVTVVTAYGFLVALRFSFAFLPDVSWLRIMLITGMVFLGGPWLSFPKISAYLEWPIEGFILKKALADQDASERGYADTKAAYRFVLEHYQVGEIVLIQTPRFYYWTNPTLPVAKLGGYKSLSFDEFIELARQGETGGWFIYDYSHQRHLRAKIKQYADKRFTDIYYLEDTLVKIYHFSPKDLAERRKTKK